MYAMRSMKNRGLGSFSTLRTYKHTLMNTHAYIRECVCL